MLGTPRSYRYVTLVGDGGGEDQKAEVWRRRPRDCAEFRGGGREKGIVPLNQMMKTETYGMSGVLPRDTLRPATPAGLEVLYGPLL